MEKSKTRALNLALLVTFVAILVHLYLSQQHYALKFGGITGPSVCNVNDRFNCDAVAASSYSTVFGLPLALWGALTNAALLFLLLVTRLNWTDDRAFTGRMALWGATIVAAASLVMGAISFLFMHNLCLFCIGAYILSFLGLAATWIGVGGFGDVAADLKSLFSSHRWVFFLVLAVPAIGFLSHASIVDGYGLGKIDQIARDKVQQWQQSPEQKFDLVRGLVLASKVEPRMTLVEFADYRCPHCRTAYPTLHAFTQAHPDVKLVFKHFPLDGTCNPSLEMGGGDGISCVMSFITQCEQKMRGQGWLAHHHFFDNQDSYRAMSRVDEVFEKYCAHQKLDCAALKTCADSSEIKDEVRAMAQEGLDAKIRGTPTIFVNSRLLGSGQLMPVLESAYQSLER